MKKRLIKKGLLFLASTLIFSNLVFANNEPAPIADEPQRIPFWDVVTEIPATSKEALGMSFSKKAIPWWVAIATSTAILYHNDEFILRDWQREGRNAGLGNRDNTKAVLKAGPIDLLRLPTDTGSMMYFLGDGWMHFGIAAGFMIKGNVSNSNRAFNTGLRIVHGMATSTIFNQFLKRATGRESPYVRTEERGRWSPFPSIPEYQRHTSSYDAMPSGHVMTATVVATIINTEYAEYSGILIPVSVLWISALSYQMVNNGVHWASDYPLAIGMGYVFGKAANRLGRRDSTGKESQLNWDISPTVYNNSAALSFTTQW